MAQYKRPDADLILGRKCKSLTDEGKRYELVKRHKNSVWVQVVEVSG